MRAKSALLLLLFLEISLAVQGKFIRVDTKAQTFVDASGRTRIFHGVNVVYKVPPYIPPQDGPFDPLTSMVDADLDNLRNWGFTSVRLGAMWPGTEPQKDVFNQTYIVDLKRLVSRLAQRGIYTILDVHQDLWSPFFCGEGAPDFAVHHDNSTPKFPFPIPATLPLDPHTGYPLVSACLSAVGNFAEWYLSEETGQAFQNLYENAAQIQDSFVGMWVALAEAFKDDPYVLGFELLNEPWAGNVEKHPSLLLPGKTDSKYLTPMYERLHQAIREVDDSHIILFEPMVANVGPVGFSEGPGGGSYNDRQVLSYHVYCADTDKHGDPRAMLFCNMTDEWFFTVRENDLKNMGVAGFLTEFGANYDTEHALESMNFVTGTADKYGLSWAYWQYKAFGDMTTAGGSLESFYDQDGKLQEAKVKALSRTYAPAIAGSDVTSTFDPITAVFRLQYSTIGSHTEVFLNEQYAYPTGFEVNIIPEAAAVWQRLPGETTNWLMIVHAPETPPGTLLTINIEPKR